MPGGAREWRSAAGGSGGEGYNAEAGCGDAIYASHLEPGTGERAVSFAHGDDVAGRAGCDGRVAVGHGDIWDGGLLGEQTVAGAGDSHGAGSAAQRSVAGGAGASAQIAGGWFGGGIAAGDSGEPGVWVRLCIRPRRGIRWCWVELFWRWWCWDYWRRGFRRRERCR